MGIKAKVIENQVMAISVISVSSDSSEDSVGTPAGRVILFGTIPTTIPDTTPVISPPTTQTDTTSDPSEDASSDHIPSLPNISPFLSSINDTTDGDTPDILPSLPMIQLSLRLPLIPRDHLSYLQLVVRHYVDHSSSDYFSPDDSARDSSSNSSSEASLDFHSNASSDSSSRNSLSYHSSPDLPSTYAGPSCKRRRFPMTYVPALPPISGALSPVLADLIPSPKRVRDSGYLADVEVEIDKCIAYVDALRDRGIDARVVVEAVDREESETGARGLVELRVERVTHPVMPEDTPEPAQEERAVECTYETLGSLVQRFHDHTEDIPVYRVQVIERVHREQRRRIVGVESAVTALTERIAVLEKG
ncbi:hypothetical protein Tco_1383788 [Tanacetum coccineum]